MLYIQSLYIYTTHVYINIYIGSREFIVVGYFSPERRAKYFKEEEEEEEDWRNIYEYSQLWKTQNWKDPTTGRRESRNREKLWKKKVTEEIYWKVSDARVKTINGKRERERRDEKRRRAAGTMENAKLKGRVFCAKNKEIGRERRGQGTKKETLNISTQRIFFVKQCYLWQSEHNLYC